VAECAFCEFPNAELFTVYFRNSLTREIEKFEAIHCLECGGSYIGGDVQLIRKVGSEKWIRTTNAWYWVDEPPEERAGTDKKKQRDDSKSRDVIRRHFYGDRRL
jgi:hypothetical protein